MHPDDLHHLIDRELKQLPVPRAPETLMPRVLAATVRRKAPWYTRAWLTWPLGWQVASAAALVALCAGVFVISGLTARPVAPVAPRVVSAPAGGIAQVPGVLENAATIVRLGWRLLLAPAAFASLVLLVSLSLACAAIWTALDRIALGGASHQ